MRPLILTILCATALFLPHPTQRTKITVDGVPRPIQHAIIPALENTKLVELKQLQVVATAAKPAPSVAVAGCGDNAMANYVYMHESGCRLDARNPDGCLGIGQACPGSKLLAVCPALDYACQNAFFTNYASKYGGWAGSYAFWLKNHWW